MNFWYIISGECDLCQSTPDILERCWSRLRSYEAISSPEYICQTSPDPILSAFELCSIFTVQAELNDGTFRVSFASALVLEIFSLFLFNPQVTVAEPNLHCVIYNLCTGTVFGTLK